MRIRYSAKLIGGDGKWYRAPYFSVGASTVLEKVASRVDPNELEPGPRFPVATPWSTSAPAPNSR